MAIKLSSETIIPLQQAAKFLPGRPHIRTVYRWIGLPQNPLETFKVEGKIFTTVEACWRFVEVRNRKRVVTPRQADKAALVARQLNDAFNEHELEALAAV